VLAGDDTWGSKKRRDFRGAKMRESDGLAGEG
jgi:hypothetical protein